MLCNASVNALQIMFSNSLYGSTANWETSQTFKEDIVGARLAGASLTKMATLLSVARAAVSKVMIHTNHGRTSSAKRNSGQKRKLSERDCCTLKRIVSINRRSTEAKVTSGT